MPAVVSRRLPVLSGLFSYYSSISCRSPFLRTTEYYYLHCRECCFILFGKVTLTVHHFSLFFKVLQLSRSSYQNFQAAGNNVLDLTLVSLDMRLPTYFHKDSVSNLEFYFHSMYVYLGCKNALYTSNRRFIQYCLWGRNLRTFLLAELKNSNLVLKRMTNEMSAVTNISFLRYKGVGVRQNCMYHLWMASQLRSPILCRWCLQKTASFLHASDIWDVS